MTSTSFELILQFSITPELAGPDSGHLSCVYHWRLYLLSKVT